MVWGGVGASTRYATEETVGHKPGTWSQISLKKQKQIKFLYLLHTALMSSTVGWPKICDLSHVTLMEFPFQLPLVPWSPDFCFQFLMDCLHLLFVVNSESHLLVIQDSFGSGWFFTTGTYQG